MADIKKFTTISKLLTCVSISSPDRKASFLNCDCKKLFHQMSKFIIHYIQISIVKKSMGLKTFPQECNRPVHTVVLEGWIFNSMILNSIPNFIRRSKKHQRRKKVKLFSIYDSRSELPDPLCKLQEKPLALAEKSKTNNTSLSKPV